MNVFLLWSVVDIISVHYGLERRTLRIFYVGIFRKQQICDSAFWRRVIIPRNNTVSVANTIRMWIKKLVESGSMLKTENIDIYHREHGRYVMTHENVKPVRAVVEWSPRRSACKHAVAFGMYTIMFRGFLSCTKSFILITQSELWLL